MLSAPVIEKHAGILVVRDDLITGGTKRRAIPVLFDDHEEYVYASPVYGAAQIALAHTASEYGKRATIFCAKRKQLAPFTHEAELAGAKIVEVPMGFLTVITARAKEYCERTGAKLLPFGLDDPAFIEALADVARALPITPKEVWSITSSGTLSRALQLAWPEATFYGVRVGHPPDAGRAVRVFEAPEAFHKPANFLPPFPSMPNFDAKAWQFVSQYATPGALFWNVSR